jgi:hypothetical protein
MASKAPSKFYSGQESSSEEEEQQVKAVEKKAAGGGRYDDSEEEEGEEARVVRTEKEKKFDALLTIVTAIRNTLRNNNWPEVQNGEVYTHAQAHNRATHPCLLPLLNPLPPPPSPSSHRHYLHPLLQSLKGSFAPRTSSAPS